jgi:predicted DNA-binding protein YlxM (UPF0122 family)
MEVKETRSIESTLAQKIIEDYNNELTIRSISKKYNVMYNRVNRVLVINNIKKRTTSDNNKLADYKKSCKLHFLDDKPKTCSELKALYSNGLSLIELGKHFNVSHVTIKNWLIRLGVELRTIKESNSLLSTKVRRADNMREKYGVDNPMQLIDIHLKAMKSGYRLKHVKVNGRLFTVQGFEPQALEYLVGEGINVNNISVGIDVPTISYMYKGGNKKYFPDFFHEESNVVYEVKSAWTYSQQKSKNIAKAKATAAIGYKHITLIFDNKGVNLVDTIVTV